MTVRKEAHRLAHEHATWFSGAWFASASLLLVSPLGAITLLALALQALGGEPVGAYLWMIFASVGIPLIPAFGLGALVGPRILRLPSGTRVRAAAWGSGAALGALLIWFLLLEGIPRLFAGGAQTGGGGGDVPGAALVVGYMIFIPLIVALPLLVGAVAGVLLQAFGARGRQAFHREKRRP